MTWRPPPPPEVPEHAVAAWVGTALAILFMVFVIWIIEGSA